MSGAALLFASCTCDPIQESNQFGQKAERFRSKLAEAETTISTARSYLSDLLRQDTIGQNQINSEELLAQAAGLERLADSPLGLQEAFDEMDAAGESCVTCLQETAEEMRSDQMRDYQQTMNDKFLTNWQSDRDQMAARIASLSDMMTGLADFKTALQLAIARGEARQFMQTELDRINGIEQELRQIMKESYSLDELVRGVDAQNLSSQE